MATNTINITETIDKSELRPFQIGVFVLCGLCLIMDGFDVQSWGFVAPALFAEWGTKSSAGTVARACAIVPLGSLTASPTLFEPESTASTLTWWPTGMATATATLLNPATRLRPRVRWTRRRNAAGCAGREAASTEEPAAAP